MRNDEVITKFIMGESAHSSNKNLRTDGEKLINYNTVIAQKIGRTIVVSSTKYSSTTSKIQNQLKRAILDNGCYKIELRDMGW
jgi:hypothetical protein